MSILNKPYEISLWDDIWDQDAGCFVEQKICVIGSDTMNSQSKVIEPTFTRNVNGTKKMAFKMYKKYIDTMTGEEVINPFSQYLVSERKVKLKYGTYIDENGDEQDCWYDFLIKNIAENSSTYLYTYQLEDALVNELSKNGYGVTLDTELMNNLGTAEELAAKVLEDTDWLVDPTSEALVQTIEESLVYVRLPSSYAGNIYQISDQRKDNLVEGVAVSQVSAAVKSQLLGKTALAFYSSCTGKPHRFQFIYSIEKGEENGTLHNLLVDPNRIIMETDCQYFIEIDDPNDENTGYTEEYQEYGFALPKGFKLCALHGNIRNTEDTTVSNWYKGDRYGFAQDTIFVPKLDRYVNRYLKNDVEYYGYLDSEYISPVLISNLVTNAEFKSNSGWIGAYDTQVSESKREKPTIEALYGRFSNGTFTTAIDDLAKGILQERNGAYQSYLKVTFPASIKTLLINTGPYDNRTLIGNMTHTDEWAFRCEAKNSAGATTVLTNRFDLGEYAYDSADTGGYHKITDHFDFNSTTKIGTNGKSYKVFSLKSSAIGYSEKDFKRFSNLKLCLTSQENTTTSYYLDTVEFFKVAYAEDGRIMVPDDQAQDITDGIVKNTYNYFKKSKLDSIQEKSELVMDYSTNKLVYTDYKPIYVEGAKKVRTVSGKESNYFNILQSIAETFEAWLILKIVRDPDTGAILQKFVQFKNYSGGDNYANFRYGVNLKDITRTFESKNIVTKLLVKTNSNEHAKNGFCTIARAESNPTGENYIYDFQYYHNTGLLAPQDYISAVYSLNGARGADRQLFRYAQSSTTPSAPTSKEESAIWHKVKRKNDTHCAVMNLWDYTPSWTVYGINREEDLISNDFNINGYYNRLKNINNLAEGPNERLSQISIDLAKLKAEKEVADATYSAAVDGLEEVENDFYTLTGLSIRNINDTNINSVTIDATNKGSDADDKWGHVSYTATDWLASTRPVAVSVSGVGSNPKLTFTVTASSSNSSERGISITAYPIIKNKGGKTIRKTIKATINIAANTSSGTYTVPISLVDTSRGDVRKYLESYATYQQEKTKSDAEKTRIEPLITAKTYEYEQLYALIQRYSNWKKELNKIFYSRYSRFIQEGTWIDEEYVDDEKYYADALSVLYNSCYPQVAYTINVVALDGIEGYEMFNFDIGEKTYVEDPAFFGENYKEQVIIAEMTEVLDDPSRDIIRVQNFKNQFQDLFQKITATTQQVKYSTGAYEKAVALAEAGQQEKYAFLSSALDSAESVLSNAGQQSVVWDNGGISITDLSNQTKQLRAIGGAILLSKQDENGQLKWTTGLTADGLSANLITAGKINTGTIQIMNGNESRFMWNGSGLNAYYYENDESSPARDTFVRFDRFGIYGINGNADCDAYNPSDLNQIDNDATFSLTWKGLKVTGDNTVVARIGKERDSIVRISNETGDIFKVTNSGSLEMVGKITAGDGEVGGWAISPGRLSSGNTYLFSQDQGSSYLDIAGTTSNEWRFYSGGNFGVTKNGILYANEAIISGNITATGGNIAGWAINREYDINNLLTKASITFGTLGRDGGFHMYAAGYPNSAIFGSTESKDWALGIGQNFGVTKNGELYASAGKIGNLTITQVNGLDGRINTAQSTADDAQTTADGKMDFDAEDGYVGGWNIDSYELWSGQAGIYSGSTKKCTSLVSSNSSSPVRFYCGSTDPTTGTFRVLNDGSLYASAAKIEGEITAEKGLVGGWNIAKDCIWRSSRADPNDQLLADDFITQLDGFGLTSSYSGKYGKESIKIGVSGVSLTDGALAPTILFTQSITSLPNSNGRIDTNHNWHGSRILSHYDDGSYVWAGLIFAPAKTAAGDKRIVNYFVGDIYSPDFEGVYDFKVMGNDTTKKSFVFSKNQPTLEDIIADINYRLNSLEA